MDRTNGIGGSDMAALLGLSKRRTRMQLYLSAIGEIPEREGDEAMLWGNLLEPLILDEYARRCQVDLERNVEVVAEGRPHLRGHLDALVKGAPVGVEAKTNGIVGFWGTQEWGEEGTDQIPDAYLGQCHFYMGLMPSIERFEVPALLAGRGLQIYMVERNQPLSDRLLDEADRFWREHVEPRRPPEMDGSVEAAQWLTRRYPAAKLPMLESTPELDEIAARVRSAKIAKKSAEGEEELCKNLFRELIGEAKGVHGAWGRALWSQVKTGGRRLSFKFNDDDQEEAA